METLIVIAANLFVLCRKAALLGSPGHDLEISVPIGVSVRNDAKKLLGENVLFDALCVFFYNLEFLLQGI